MHRGELPPSSSSALKPSLFSYPCLNNLHFLASPFTFLISFFKKITVLQQALTAYPLCQGMQPVTVPGAHGTCRPTCSPVGAGAAEAAGLLPDPSPLWPPESHPRKAEARLVSRRPP